jgi:hypothetical protein
LLLNVTSHQTRGYATPDKQHDLGRSILGILNSLNDPRMPPADE